MRSVDRRVAPPVSSTRAAIRSRARVFGAALAATVAISLGGCSVSYPLFGPDADDIKTGSIDAEKATPVAPTDHVTSTPLAPPPGASAATADTGAAAAPVAYAPKDREEPAITPSDWSYARGALSLAMGADATNASVPWANPDSGAYGSFSATAGATNDNGATCRMFSASHSARGHEQRLEGTACRTAAGYWEAVAIRATASRTL